MKLKCCPRKQCQSPAVVREMFIEDTNMQEKGWRAVCTICNVMGPWGGKTGPEGEIKAAEFWNEDWGRDG